MGFVTDMFDSDKGAGFQATSANLMNPVQQQDVVAANNTVNSGIAQQQGFANALLGSTDGALTNQNILGAQLAQQAQGLGPNPAQAQYQQNLNNISAQQAGAISSQKGLSPALQARMIAQQGGNAMQGAAAAQAAAQGQQQINAQQALGNLSQQQLGNSQNALTGLNQFAQGNQGNLLNSVGQFNNAQVGNQSNMNSVNGQIAGANQKSQSDGLSGLVNAGGKAIGMAHGGMVPHGGAVSAFGRSLAMKSGGEVPGMAMAKGDNPKNDVVPAMLSPEEVVLPRSVTKSKDPAAAASAFMSAILAKKGKK